MTYYTLKCLCSNVKTNLLMDEEEEEELLKSSDECWKDQDNDYNEEETLQENRQTHHLNRDEEEDLTDDEEVFSQPIDFGDDYIYQWHPSNPKSKLLLNQNLEQYLIQRE